jgi:hypothetical protein
VRQKKNNFVFYAVQKYICTAVTFVIQDMYQQYTNRYSSEAGKMTKRALLSVQPLCYTAGISATKDKCCYTHKFKIMTH